MIFDFLAKLIFTIREKFIRNILKPQTTSPPQQEAAQEKQKRLQAWVAAAQTRPEKPEEDYPEVSPPVLGRTKPTVVLPATTKAPSPNPYLLYKRQSFLSDLKDSLLSAIPFWPQGKKEQANEQQLQKALEDFAQTNPEFVKSPQYQLLQEALKPLAQRLPRLTSSQIVPEHKLEERVSLFRQGISALRLETDIPARIVRFVSEPAERFQIPSLVTRGTKGLGQNIISQTGIGAKSLGSWLLRGSGQLAVRGLVGIGSFIGTVSTGAAVLSGSWIIIIIVGVFAFAFLFFYFQSFIRLFAGPVGGAPPPAGSQYISIEKTSSPTLLKNEELPAKVRFTLVVKPKKGELVDVEIRDVASASNKDGTRTIQEQPVVKESKITQGGEKKIEYEVNLGTDLADSVVSNNVIVGANATGQPARQTETVSSTIRIGGTPPEECPGGWPTNYGFITQGPGVGTHTGGEAVDIGITHGMPILRGQPVKATSRGVVTTYDTGTTGYGKHVILQTSCNGKTVNIIYAHLDSFGVTSGQKVAVSTTLGTVGNTGNSDGPHLHYEFRGLEMAPPYIPAAPRGFVRWGN